MCFNIWGLGFVSVLGFAVWALGLGVGYLWHEDIRIMGLG